MTEKTTNHMAVLQLQLLGFPLPNIRISLHKLTGISQPYVAETIETSRINVTHHMAGRRTHRDIQDKIAKVFEIPAEVLFEDVINQN